jgi:hypothetical protein
MDQDFTARTASVAVDLRFYNADSNQVIVGGELGNLPVDVTDITIQDFEIINPSTAYGIVRTLDNATSSPLMQDVIYENRDTSGCDNLVYIGWINSKGGYEQWMFDYKQTVERNVEQGLISESPINTDIENVSRTKRRFPNLWRQQIILTADHLKTDQLKGLMEIEQSDYVVAYITSDLSEQITVIVSNGYTTQWNTGDELHSFTLQIEFPDNYDFLLAKQY